MTATGQIIKLYIGNDAAPLITVYSDASETTPLDLSAAVALEWDLYDGFGVSVLSKTKQAGQITLPNGGSDGEMQVAVPRSDTGNLTEGWYAHRALVTDVSGKVSTVETGRALAVDDTKGS